MAQVQWGTYLRKYNIRLPKLRYSVFSGVPKQSLGLSWPFYPNDDHKRSQQIALVDYKVD